MNRLKPSLSGIHPLPALPSLWALPLFLVITAQAGLAQAGAAWTQPSFPGDGFLLPLPARDVASWTPQQARDELVPLLQAAGFARAGELGLPDAFPASLEPPDLEALGAEVCQEEMVVRAPRDRAVCEALAGGSTTPSALDREVRAWVEEETATLRALARSAPAEHVFPQRVDGVPIEGAGVIVRTMGKGEEGIESVRFAYGTLFDQYEVTNRPRLTLLAAASLARRGLLPQTGLSCPCVLSRASDRIDLVLLPTRTKPSPELRYAYRTLLQASESRPGERASSRSWMVWIDAESGEILRLQPQFADLRLPAHRFRRDPSTKLVEAPLRVETPGAGQGLQLRYARVFGRLDLNGNGDFGDGEVEVDPARAATLGDPSEASRALCASEGGSAIRQINAYAHLYRFWRTITAAGSIDPFPEKPIAVWMDIDDEDETNQAEYDLPSPYDLGLGALEPAASVLWFSLGGGSSAKSCPDQAGKRLNGALDATTLTHELAHLAVMRLQERRPLDWCGSATCPLPNGRWTFHDFADAFAGAYASTNCMSGWTDKNAPGDDPKKGRTDQGLGCRGPHSEGGRFPRLANELDRFPEHRSLAKIGEKGYADGQIAAAALWFTREGLRSRSLAAGSNAFWILLNRALRAYGFLAPSCELCDRDIYRYLQTLELQLLAAAAPPGSSLSGREAGHEIVNGFARAGIFLVPLACLDGDPATGDPDACPREDGGESGGDAIVDLDDDEPGDDVTVDGVLHRETDFLRRKGPAPAFTVWTGPLYRFQKNGSAGLPPFAKGLPAPCNGAFQVEVGTDPAFASPVKSGWRPVERSKGGCRGVWSPSQEEWDLLRGAAQEASAETRIYYRATTRNGEGRSGEGKNVRLSTEPGNGRFRLPPASAIVNATGRP